MKQEKMDRISELTCISKQRELTAEEQAERAALREEYLAEWRNSTKAILDNAYVVDARGVRKKLGRKDNK